MSKPILSTAHYQFGGVAYGPGKAISAEVYEQHRPAHVLNAPDEAGGAAGYGGMVKNDLQAALDARGIEYAAKATNAELVALLEADDASTDAAA